MEKISFAIFDDHQIGSDALKRTLNANFRLKFTFKTDSRLALLKGLKSTCPDILFVSYPFSNKDSYEVIEMARDKSKKVKLFVLAHSIKSETVLKLINEGANCVLPMAASMKDLKVSISEVMKKEYHFTDLFSQSMLDELRKRKVLRKSVCSEITFSDKKIAIINYLYAEYSHKEIGRVMKLQPKSVDNYVTTMIHEVGAKNVVGLLKFGIKHNLIKSDK